MVSGVTSRPSVFLTVGLPGAGKTTSAKEIASAHRILRLIGEVAGAAFSLEYVQVDERERRERATRRWLEAPHTTFERTAADHDRFASMVQPPSRNEPDNGPVSAPPTGHPTWLDWASSRWPTLPLLGARAGA